MYLSIILQTRQFQLFVVLTRTGGSLTHRPFLAPERGLGTRLNRRPRRGGNTTNVPVWVIFRAAGGLGLLIELVNLRKFLPRFTL